MLLLELSLLECGEADFRKNKNGCLLSRKLTVLQHNRKSVHTNSEKLSLILYPHQKFFLLSI